MNVWIFGIPIALFLVLPLLTWFIVFVTQGESGITSEPMYLLFAAFVVWVQVPGILFRQPLFDLVDVGYFPHGFLGWSVVIMFYVALSLVISLTLRYLLSRDRSRQII